MEIVAVPVTEAVVSKVTENLVDSVWRQIAYVWNHKSNIKDLKYAVDQLKDEKTAMEHRVEAARRNGEEIEESVKNWQTIVEETIKVAQKILDDNEKANMTCCFIGCFSNLKRRHQLSRKAKKEIVEIDKVRQGGKFEIISYLRPLPGIRSDKDYKAFESRRVVLEEIMEAIKGTDVSLIGVYGMSGVGKTTLAKKVAEQVKEDGNIKVVAFAEVTKNVDVRRIQRDIAEWLGLQFDVESIGVRAARLCERLKQEEKFLIILDDIWEKLKLEDIGIPFGNDHKGGKILMTSCSLKVLKPMDVQRHFQLLELQLEEAWHLFEEKAGDVEDPDLKPMATQVANRCAGLPILIMAVAKALKGKGLHAWSDALLRLKRSDNDEFEPRVNSGLEICYNELKKDEEKSLFRLCGQLAPQSILIRDLLKYCMGLGLFNQINTVKQSRDRLLTLLHSLKSSCLLLEGEDDHHVRMHDVIHRFALSVASKDHNVFNIAYHSVLEEWPEEVIFRQFTAVSLTIAKIPELPQELDCPNLQSFILRNIAVIGELQKLQVLSLINSSNDQLPTEVGKLTRLRLLDLSRCQRLEVIPVGVLSCLTQLEDLYMGDSLVKWENEERGGQRSNASLDELKLLKKLVTLELHIIDAEKLPENLFSEKLERFRIFIGEDWDWSGKYVMSRTLKLKVNRSTELERVKVLLKRSEDLYLEDLKGVKNVLYELDWQGSFDFKNLKILKVHSCSKLRYVFTPSMCLGLVQLQELEVKSCDVMAEIINEGLAMEETNKEVLFPLLNSIILESLPRLINFSSGSSVVQCPSLKEIRIVDCPTAFTCTFLGEAEANATHGIIEPEVVFPNLEELQILNMDNLKMIWSSQLQSDSFGKVKVLKMEQSEKLLKIYPSGMLRSLRNLEDLIIKKCSTLEVVFDLKEVTNIKEKVASQLRKLVMEDLPNLKHVWNEDRLGLVSFDKLSSVYVSQCDSLITLAPSSACFQSLTTLDLVKCNKLESLVASSTAKSLIQLTEMSIKECDGMKEILTNEGDEPNEEIIFSRLRSLKLQCLPSLLSFCSSVHCFKFPFLTQVIVRQCPKMQVFSRGSVITPKLQSVQQLTEDKTDKERWSGNLNATIQQLFIDMVDDEVERR
ncbi:Disease resistance protein RPS2, putative [Ricinus communis]|uniref:Disease resistance protein RPS2, putative n=1 Tax=Ricinus communis TaxID=3988 RepID=B9T074_RICCO|nr:Disease resistance protein RPS2, putative [Ricinus communis]